MPTIDVRVAADLDSVIRSTSGAGSVGQFTIMMGVNNGGTAEFSLGARFTNILIPQGAIITAAHLVITVEIGVEGNKTILSDIFGENVDNAAQFDETLADFNDRPRTTASVAYDGVKNWTPLDAEEQLTDMTLVVQEIVNRPGWPEGGAMAFFWEEGGAAAGQHLHGYLHSVDAAKAPLLHVEFTLRGPAPAMHDPGGSFTRRLSGGRGGFLSYITPDGRTYPFHTPHPIGRWVISYSGFGTPPIEYVTERGPFQHGETVRDYFLRPRVIQLLIRQGFCDRVAWWGGRADLLNEIRPNRQATPTGVQPGELQLVETDGTIRSLHVWIQDGPRFEARESGQWDEWAFQEVLRFIAYDPIAFDPTQVTAAFVVALDPNLVFPITFPIQFGTGVLDEALDVTYPGTWLSFPVITIVGPIENPRIDNVTTGEKIELTANIAAGRTITIDLTEGNKTVVDDLGNNLLGQVTPDSDLGTWHLAPDPEAPLGVNTLRLRGTNPTGSTAVSLAYFERYFGF